MIEISDKCTGCLACKYICPKSAISVSENSEGFIYPIVDEQCCINCSLCERVCPINKSIDCDYAFKQNYYAARLIDRNKRLETQSGGVCDAFSSVAIKGSNGVVYGVGFDNNWNAIHKRACDAESIKEFRGSKYVQSDVSGVYDSIRDDILNDSIDNIVVTGTACQIAGIKSFLKLRKLSTEKVVFVDIICHGVPSPKIWRDYLNFENRKENLRAIKFRDKRFGWCSHTETFVYNKSRRHSRRFTHLFYMEVISRKCCSSCKYASYSRESDVTVADFWGYSKAGFKYDSFGISECLVNTKKGDTFLKACSELLEIIPITREQADQWNLNQPTIVDTSLRDKFWLMYNTSGYPAVRDAFCKDEIKNEWKIYIFYALKSLKRLLLGR